jgi:hypothetical protein
MERKRCKESPWQKAPKLYLVDWMAVACIAKVDPKQLNFADVWDSTFSESIIDVDD